MPSAMNEEPKCLWGCVCSPPFPSPTHPTPGTKRGNLTSLYSSVVQQVRFATRTLLGSIQLMGTKRNFKVCNLLFSTSAKVRVNNSLIQLFF